MIRTGLQWFYNQTGLAASSHLESGGFARTTDKIEHPDIQFHFLVILKLVYFTRSLFSLLQSTTMEELLVHVMLIKFMLAQ